MTQPRLPAINLQQLVGAAERLRRAAPEHPEEYWMLAVESARDRLAIDPFCAQPLQGFVVRSGERARAVGSPTAADRVIEEALRPPIERYLATRLAPCVHGYVRGRGTGSAARALRESLRQGRTQLAFLDIADFFPSVRHAALRAALIPWLAPELVEIVLALIAAPTRRDGELQYPDIGLPLGRPLSPSLSNLVLLDIDAAMTEQPGTYLRYGDDIAIAAATEPERAACERSLRTAVEAAGFQLRESKARRLEYTGAPVIYLGHAVDTRGVYRKLDEPRSGAAAATPTPDAGAPPVYASVRRRTLYVTEPGLYVRIAKGMIVFTRGRQALLEVPLRRVERIVIFTHLSLSSGFVSSCVVRRIPVFFLVGRGRAYGALVASGLPHPLRLRAQYDLLTMPGTRLHLARQIVTAKLAAMRRRLRTAPEARSQLERIDGISSRLASCSTPDELRGHEGAATAAYYEGFATRIRIEAFAFTKRSRRPPKDAINSLLSFTYSLLFGELQTALLAHGLDPSPALLHEAARNHPALASDLMEPYRALIADSFVLRIVNQRTMTPEDFEAGASGAVLLTLAGRRKLLQAYESYMTTKGAGGRAKAPPRWLVDAAARAMLDVVLGSTGDLILPLVPAHDEDAGEEDDTGECRPDEQYKPERLALEPPPPPDGTEK